MLCMVLSHFSRACPCKRGMKTKKMKTLTFAFGLMLSGPAFATTYGTPDTCSGNFAGDNPLVVVDERLFDGERYALHAWVVMPNHVHVLCGPAEGWSLPDLVQAWKSYTAKRANTALGRHGTLWQDDFFDRYVRDRIFRPAGMTLTFLTASPDWHERARKDRRVDGTLIPTTAEWPYRRGTGAHPSTDSGAV